MVSFYRATLGTEIYVRGYIHSYSHSHIGFITKKGDKVQYMKYNDGTRTFIKKGRTYFDKLPVNLGRAFYRISVVMNSVIAIDADLYSPTRVSYYKHETDMGIRLWRTLRDEAPGLPTATTNQAGNVAFLASSGDGVHLVEVLPDRLVSKPILGYKPELPQFVPNTSNGMTIEDGSGFELSKVIPIDVASLPENMREEDPNAETLFFRLNGFTIVTRFNRRGRTNVRVAVLNGNSAYIPDAELLEDLESFKAIISISNRYVMFVTNKKPPFNVVVMKRTRDE